MDVYAVEQTGFRGCYFVLKGHLSPLDGLGPEAIGIPQLMARIEEAGTFTEVILATNPTVEGEATAIRAELQRMSDSLDAMVEEIDIRPQLGKAKSDDDSGKDVNGKADEHWDPATIAPPAPAPIAAPLPPPTMPPTIAPTIAEWMSVSVAAATRAAAERIRGVARSACTVAPSARASPKSLSRLRSCTSSNSTADTPAM